MDRNRTAFCDIAGNLASQLPRLVDIGHSAIGNWKRMKVDTLLSTHCGRCPQAKIGSFLRFKEADD